MLRIVPKYNRMFYRCFTTKQRMVKHLWILYFNREKYDNN
jgi:hypothetical protein